MIKKYFLMISLLVFITACATTSSNYHKHIAISDAPLPSGINIVPADPNLPPAKFLGKWFGRWDGIMDHYLIVTEVLNKEDVKAIYSFGWGHGASPNYLELKGKVKNDTLNLRWSDRDVTYKMKDGFLAASYYRPGAPFSSARMTKVE